MSQFILSLFVIAGIAQAESINLDWIIQVRDYVFSDGTQPPQRVVDAAQSVLQLKSFGGDTLTEIDGTRSEARSLALTFRDSGALPAAEQIEYCIKSRIKKCQIFERSLVGSGFKISTTGTLLTSFHLLKAQLRANFLELSDRVNLAEISSRLRRTVYLKVRDSSKNLLLSSKADPQDVQIESFNSSPLFLMVEGTQIFTQSIDGEISDLVELSINGAREINGIALALKEPSPGENLYLAGYSGVQNRLEIKIGKMIAASEFVSRTNLPTSPRDLGLRQNYLVHIDMDCNDGMSGGPILNSDGQVVGVIAGRHWDRNSRRGLCYGIKLNNLDGPNGLRTQWRIFAKQSLKYLFK